MDDVAYWAATGHPPTWATAWGEDKLGPFVSFELADVTVRMRWCPAGNFLMSSPEGEEALDDEAIGQELILTQGFWLAETATTQELWQALMGMNPSRFKGKDLPVEQVSLDDVQAFLATALERGHELRLPREFEWEYACRAGTKTPFSFGATITTQQVNYDGNFPFGGGAEGEFRAKTVPVGSLPPNPWGLFEMHGNVWERCSDWRGTYVAGQAVDASEPDEIPYRVVRGGSWRDSAGRCQSAYRSGAVASERWDFLGFRLARSSGQGR